MPVTSAFWNDLARSFESLSNARELRATRTNEGWRVHGGIGTARERNGLYGSFLDLAEKAGEAAGAADTSDGFGGWLIVLWTESPNYWPIYGIKDGNEIEIGGVIEGLADASAKHCHRMRQSAALASSRVETSAVKAPGGLADTEPPSLTELVAPMVPPRGRFTSSIASETAIRRLDRFLKDNNRTLSEFARDAGVNERTLRSFRQAKPVRVGTFDGIAKAMGTTREGLATANCPPQ